MHFPSGLMRAAALAVMVLVFQVSAVLAENKPQPMYLFIQNAEAMSFKGDKLTLSGISDKVVWFTDRPNHGAGELSLELFIEGWPKGTDSFATDPPNVALTIEGSASGPLVAVISNPRMDGADLIYDARVIYGTVPESGGRTSMVVDGECNWCLCNPITC